ncbi:hypothetical protein [Methanobacterium spitsbergense]|uniref:Uncharacterized protein n=1 Tax=Methanobacterium spitsbergense TaxID=2874285 RepID=A0A8T5URA4_9EURY|nr:hypothetical protein [Methanobacterium spitsbergense]MBZ2166288.1 hypothetical protein [Methanobacterium spitsbergense]
MGIVFSDDFSTDLSKWDSNPDGYIIESGRLKSANAGTITKNITLTDFSASFNIWVGTGLTGVRNIYFSNADGSEYIKLRMFFNGLSGCYVNLFDQNGNYPYPLFGKSYSTSNPIPVIVQKTGSDWTVTFAGTNLGTITNFGTLDISKFKVDDESGNVTYWDDFSIVTEAEMRISELNCVCNIRPDHYISSLECVTVLKEIQISSLECITTLIEPTRDELSLVGNVKTRSLLKTGFSSILHPNLLLNQHPEKPPFVNWNVWDHSYLDQINKRLSLNNFRNYGGNLKINDLNIEEGFLLKFKLGGSTALFNVMWNYISGNQQDIDSYCLDWQAASGFRTLHYHYDITNQRMVWDVISLSENNIPVPAGNYEIMVANGRVSVRLDEEIIIDSIEIPDITSRDIYISSANGLFTNSESWIDDLDIQPAPIFSNLEMVTNIRNNHNISSLECNAHIQSNTIIDILHCESTIIYPGLIKTNFDGQTLMNHLAITEYDGGYLDTENQKFVILPAKRFGSKGALFIQNFELPHGFDLEFDIEGEEFESLNLFFNYKQYDTFWSLNITPTEIKLIKTVPSGSWEGGTTIVMATFTKTPGTILGKYRLVVAANGIVDVYYNTEHIFQKIDYDANFTGNSEYFDYNVKIEASQGYNYYLSPKAYLDNLIFNVPDHVSELSAITNIRSPHRRDELECKTAIGKLYSKILTLQGSIFEDNPQKPSSNIDKLIFLSVNEVVFPNMISWDTDKQGNNKNSTFDITYRSAEDLMLFSGQKIRLTELHGNPDGFYTGIIDDIIEDNKSGERLWKISGRGEANPIITQPFHINAVTYDESQPISPTNTPPTAFTSEMWLNMIMFGSGVKKGPCVDIHVDEIFNANHLFNGFAGNWDTKADALTELMALISKLRNQNISWFLDNKGLLRIFNTDVMDESMGISIGLNEGRVLDHSVKEDGQSIINTQRGTGGKENEFEYEDQDEYSRNGWYDTDNGLSWPGYGFMPGKQIQDNSVTIYEQLQAEVHNVLDLNSRPIFTISMRLSKFPGCEIGQPIYIKDHYKLKGKTLVITSIRMSGTTAQRTTQITATTDKKILGPLSEYGTAEAIAKHQISKTAPTYGICVAKDSKGTVTIQPVNKAATENAKDLGYFKKRKDN